MVLQLVTVHIILEVGTMKKWAGDLVGVGVGMALMVPTTITVEIMLEVMQVSMGAMVEIMVDMDMDLGTVGPCMAMLDIQPVVMACLLVMVAILPMQVVKGMEVVLLVVVAVVVVVAVAVMVLVEDMIGVMDMIGVVVLQLEDIIHIKSEEFLRTSHFCNPRPPTTRTSTQLAVTVKNSRISVFVKTVVPTRMIHLEEEANDNLGSINGSPLGGFIRSLHAL